MAVSSVDCTIANPCEDCRKLIVPTNLNHYDHTNCIPRSSLPRLPEHWKVTQIDPYAEISNTSKPIPHCERLAMIWSETKTMTAGEYQFLLKLLNAAYPEGQG